MRNVLHDLGVSLERVVVTEFREHTYFAELHLVRDGQPLIVSSRPSDAVALAVRTGSPLFASEAVLDEAGQIAEIDGETAGTGEQGDHLIEEFRAFIDEVRPEDFGG